MTKEKRTFYLTFHVRRVEPPKTLDDVVGAYATCWVVADSLKEARDLAREIIHDEGWNIEEEEETAEVSSRSYENDPEGLERFREAQEHGGCYVFHSWPAHGDDDEEDTLH